MERISLLLAAGCLALASALPTKDAQSWGVGFGGGADGEEFRLLEVAGSRLLVGALEAVYNVSVDTMEAAATIRWASSAHDASVCQMKGNSARRCRNYVRVLAAEAEGRVLVCGTNAFSPLCRLYAADAKGHWASLREVAGNGICPYDPAHNSTALYLPATGQLYAGTVADFAGKDPLIHRRRLRGPGQDFGLRTERNDIKTLNEPNFVGSLSFGGATYFWLREEAVEYENCGAAVFSRVARVCEADQGGPRRHKDTWSSFLKARLNCSLPGSHPFYFDQIQAISSAVAAGDGSRLVYGVFATPDAAIRGSAVCAFRLEDMAELFQKSAFKSQAGPDANWLPVHRSRVPKPRPSACSDATRHMSDEAINFMLDNPLMDEAVPNAFPAPVLTHTTGDRLTQIAVDAQVPSVSEGPVDVLFLGTDSGRVLKALRLPDATEPREPLEALQVFRPGDVVRNLLVWRRGDSEALVAVSADQVRRLPLHNCSAAADCASCVALRDPYCAWHKAQRACLPRPRGQALWPPNLFLQSLRSGLSAQCPRGSLKQPAQDAGLPATDLLLPNHRVHHQVHPEERVGGECDCDERSQNLRSNASPPAKTPTGPSRSVSSVAAGGAVSSSSLALGVVAASLVGGLVGFVLGHLCAARRCLQRNKALARTPSSLSRSQTSPGQMSGAGLGRAVERRPDGSIDAYAARPRPPLPPDEVHHLPLGGEKNELAAEANPFATLPKDYRVKKIYL